VNARGHTGRVKLGTISIASRAGAAQQDSPLGWRVDCVIIMQITFHGAAREVTGSCHLVECDGTRTLLDCGLVQGGRERHERNRAPFPCDPATITPSYSVTGTSTTPGGFRCCGNTDAEALFSPRPRPRACLRSCWPTRATSRKKTPGRRSSGSSGKRRTQARSRRSDALALLGQLVPVGLGDTESLPEGAQVTFLPAGHILGATIIELQLDDDGRTRRLVFCGDLGVQGSRLLPPSRTVEAGLPHHGVDLS